MNLKELAACTVANGILRITRRPHTSPPLHLTICTACRCASRRWWATRTTPACTTAGHAARPPHHPAMAWRAAACRRKLMWMRGPQVRPRGATVVLLGIAWRIQGGDCGCLLQAAVWRFCWFEMPVPACKLTLPGQLQCNVDGSPPTIMLRPPCCADAVNLAVRFGAPIYVNKEVRGGHWAAVPTVCAPQSSCQSAAGLLACKHRPSRPRSTHAMCGISPACHRWRPAWRSPATHWKAARQAPAQSTMQTLCAAAGGRCVGGLPLEVAGLWRQ